MGDSFLELCDSVDAGVFSGDSLMDAGTRKEFEDYLGRWTRELKKFEELAAELAAQEEKL